jgi:hypothetical protein
MSGFHHLDLSRRPPIAMSGDSNARDATDRKPHLVEVIPFRYLDHRARSLAGGKHDDSAGLLRQSQMLAQAVVRMCIGDGGEEQFAQKRTRVRFRLGHRQFT